MDDRPHGYRCPVVLDVLSVQGALRVSHRETRSSLRGVVREGFPEEVTDELRCEKELEYPGQGLVVLTQLSICHVTLRKSLRHCRAQLHEMVAGLAALVGPLPVLNDDSVTSE